MIKETPETMTIKEAAALLRCSPDHVEALLREQLFDFYDISLPGSKRPLYRIDRTSLEAWQHSRKVNYRAVGGRYGKGLRVVS